MPTDTQPKLIIHGGAGSSLKDKGGLIAVRQALHAIVAETYDKLQAGADAKTAVIYGCRRLEDHPRFNAGKGSVLQSDGQVRMSAALMDGATQAFGGVINVSRIEHPIEMAAFLQQQTDRVLSDYGAAELARRLEMPVFDPVTDLRLNEWMQERQGNFSKAMAGVVAEPDGLVAESGGSRHGTIGVVALDSRGQIAAGTSTGGKGLEQIGRVSDSAMPAGNYANSKAGVSCTGIGEDIIDECLAARLVIRVSDGLSLQQALERSFAEATQNGRDFGAISLDCQGTIGWGKTSDVLLAAFHTGDAVGDTLELPTGTQTDTI
ncbi:MAG: isoaspartyl peptidase/L-asparaginase [Cyanobacteria bacterium P01_A01_bin.114]